MTTLHIDASRSGKHSTGILTRALDPKTNKVRVADIGELAVASLITWLRDNPNEAIVKRLLGHVGPSSPSVPPISAPSADQERATATALRVRKKLVDRINAGDLLITELASEAMRYILDILRDLDEAYDPAAASMVGLLITENAGRTKTGREMWRKYQAENAPQSLANFRERLQQARSGKDI